MILSFLLTQKIRFAGTNSQPSPGNFRSIELEVTVDTFPFRKTQILALISGYVQARNPHFH